MESTLIQNGNQAGLLYSQELAAYRTQKHLPLEEVMLYLKYLSFLVTPGPGTYRMQTEFGFQDLANENMNHTSNLTQNLNFA